MGVKKFAIWSENLKRRDYFREVCRQEDMRKWIVGEKQYEGCRLD
jgi:hypothetical protein